MESELELVDMLPLRRLKEGEAFCCVPDSPSVVTDKRRRPSLAAAPPVVLPPRWKRLDMAACVIELRRWRLGCSPLGTAPFPLPSEDIALVAEFALYKVI
jgi:hypothetical protein